MPRMSQSDLKFWKERLRHSHRLWNEMGLTGESAAKGVLRALYAYRGKQWENPGWGGLNEEDLLVVNLLFANTNTMLAQLSARSPTAKVKPRNRESQSAAPIVERILDYYIDELKMKREHDLCLLDACLMPFGIMRHGYTPQIEFFEKDGERMEIFGGARPDVPWMRRIPIWDFRLDTRASFMGSDRDARWCAFRDLMTIDEVNANDAMKSPKDLHATVSWDKIASTPYPNQRMDGPDENKFVEVWSIYDYTDQVWFQLSTGSRYLLRDPDDWPIRWGSLPFEALAFNPQADSMFPVSFPEIEWKLYMELNKTRTIINELVKRLRRIILVNDEALADGEADKMIDDGQLSEFFRTNGADIDKIIKEVQVNGGNFQELLQYANTIKEDLREMRGISNLDRGQRINVTSASEANYVQQGSTIQGDRNLEKFEGFWKGNVRKWVKGLQKVTTRPIIIPIVGQADTAQLEQAMGDSGPFLDANPSQIQGEFLFDIEAGSTAQADRQQEIQQEVAFFQLLGKETLINQQESIRNLVVAFGKDPQKAMVPMQVMQGAQKGIDQMGAGQQGGNGQGGPVQLPQSGAGAQPAINPDLLGVLSRSTGATRQ